MDQMCAIVRPFELASPASIAIGARVVSFLHKGGRAVVLAGSDSSQVLELVLDGMPGRVLRVRGGGVPLTVAAMLAQIGAEVPDVGIGQDAAALVRCLTERAHEAGPAVLAVHGAEALTPDALTALARVPGLGGPDLPGAILLLAGRPGLVKQLAAPGLERLREGQGALIVGDEAATDALEEVDLPAVARVPAPQVRQACGVGGAVLMLGLVAASLAAASLAGVDRPAALPAVTAAAVLDGEAGGVEPYLTGLAESVSLDGLVPREQASMDPAPQAAVPAAVDGQLRRDFQAFLDRAGRDTAALPAAAREELFREYLEWRNRTATVRPVRN